MLGIALVGEGVKDIARQRYNRRRIISVAAVVVVALATTSSNTPKGRARAGITVLFVSLFGRIDCSRLLVLLQIRGGHDGTQHFKWMEALVDVCT